MLNAFTNWMAAHTELSSVSIKKYVGAVRVTSREMLEAGVIPKPLTDMNLMEIDIAVAAILGNPQFRTKNKIGNNMYSSSIKQYRYFLKDSWEDCFETIADSVDITTEYMATIKARVGQAKYRQQLLEKYVGRCVITGISQSKLLVASHIKPWSVCSDVERVDVENGLLLSANMDRLFDSGLLTFGQEGRMFISNFVSEENRSKLHISKDTVIDLHGSSRLFQYMEYHRDVLFVR